MSNENKQLDWGAFEAKSSTDFLKIENGKAIKATFSKVEIVSVPAEDENGNPKTDKNGNLVQKPQLQFTLDSVDGQPCVKIWNTGNRQIVATVKNLVDAGIFQNWIYQISKAAPAGNSKYSSYSLIQIAPKPAKPSPAKAGAGSGLSPRQELSAFGIEANP